MKNIEGNAIVYCEGAYNTPNGKTAHGLVRFTDRYNVVCVIDSNYAGKDAGYVLDEINNGILIVSNLEEALEFSEKKGCAANYCVMGLAPDGGKLPVLARNVIIEAIKKKLNIDSGLHDFLSEDNEISKLAEEYDVKIRDIRKAPHRKDLHFFSGDIEKVKSLKIALLGTDSALGKRTTAWILVHALRKAGITADMIGTGQTSWMQGAKFSMVLDSLVNDFVAGEIEHAIYSCYKENNPEVIVIEGQGSLMNPAYPGGFEILAAGRPDFVILQHAPARIEYDGFPGYLIQPISEQINAIEIISSKPVKAITVNHENLTKESYVTEIEKLKKITGLPVVDVLKEGADLLVDLVKRFLNAKNNN